MTDEAGFVCRTYDASVLPAIVEYWNAAFRDRRNFWEISEETFRRRVAEKMTAVEAFDPRGLVVAVEGDRVVGMVHAGITIEAVCRLVEPGWPGGDRGYVAFLHVLPERRRRGIGTTLWYRALDHLTGCAKVVVDGQCLNPFYGNSEGPFAPFWGTPEGIGAAWDDAETKKFLARKGFAPRHKAVQLEHLFALLPAVDAPAELAKHGLTLEFLTDRYPEVGSRLDDPPRFGAEYAFECAVALGGGRVQGMVGYFPMTEVAGGVYGIYETHVAADLRGRGVGRTILVAALARMRSLGATRCDVTTIPDLSPGAVEAYESVGFRRCGEWAVY